jgi:hypothetical protein
MATSLEASHIQIETVGPGESNLRRNSAIMIFLNNLYCENSNVIMM